MEPSGADALTVNGHLGSDGIRPLPSCMQGAEKGIFVLVKTSNPSSGELQDRLIDSKPVWEIMGEMCEGWGADLVGNKGSAVGAVVGATYPKQLEELRANYRIPSSLCPVTARRAGSSRRCSRI